MKPITLSEKVGRFLSLLAGLLPAMMLGVFFVISFAAVQKNDDLTRPNCAFEYIHTPLTTGYILRLLQFIIANPVTVVVAGLLITAYECYLFKKSPRKMLLFALITSFLIFTLTMWVFSNTLGVLVQIRRL